MVVGVWRHVGLRMRWRVCVCCFQTQFLVFFLGNDKDAASISFIFECVFGVFVRVWGERGVLDRRAAVDGCSNWAVFS